MIYAMFLNYAVLGSMGSRACQALLVLASVASVKVHTHHFREGLGFRV